MRKSVTPHLPLKMEDTSQKVNYGRASYYIQGNLLYVACMFPVIYMLGLLPSYQLGNWSYIFEIIYKRPNYFTEWFSLAKYLTWMTLLIVGFTFVNVVNLDFYRGNPFWGRDNTYKDISKLVVIGTVMFFISPVIAL